MKSSVKNTEVATYKRAARPKAQNRILQLIKSPSGVAAAAGIFLSRACMMTAMAPLGLAWYSVCTALDKSSIVAAGCLLGAFLCPVGLMKIKYVAALFTYWVIKKYISTDKWENAAFSSGVAAGVMLFCGILYSAFTGFVYFDIIVSFIESAAVWCCGIIFEKAAAAVERCGKITCDDESIAVAIFAGSVIAGTQDVGLFGIKLANIASMYIILFCAYRGGVGISGAAGAALGIIAGVSQGDAPALTGVFAFVGLTAGVMSVFGKWGVCLAALCANAVFAAYYNSSLIVLINVVEIIFAAALFFATPDRAMNFLEHYSMKTKTFDSDASLKLKINAVTEDAFFKINRLLYGIRGAFSQNGARGDNLPPAVLCDRLCARVCDCCNLRRYCWNRNFNGTSLMFSRLAEAVESGGDLKGIVAGRCIRSDALVSGAAELYETSCREKADEEKNRQCISEAFGGWDAAEKILTAAQSAFYENASYLQLESAEISKSISEITLQACSAAVVTNFRKMPEVSTLTKSEFSFDASDVVGEILKMPMYLADEKITQDGCLTRFLPEETFCHEIATVTMDNQSGEVSGDFSDYFTVSGGYVYCIICDGMGSGASAGEDSRRAAEIFGALCAGTLALEDIAGTLNRGIMTSWGEERCISADMVRIDLFTGEIQLVKAGGAASVIKCDGSVSLVENALPPLGILDFEKTDKRTFFIQSDAYLVLMTDGVPDNRGQRDRGEEFVRSIVDLSGEVSAKELADTILMSAITGGSPKDDMLVTVIKLYRR